LHNYVFAKVLLVNWYPALHVVWSLFGHFQVIIYIQTLATASYAYTTMLEV